MASLLARLGHLQTRRTGYGIQSSGKRPTKNEPTCVECRAVSRQTLSQSRSYGADQGSFRSSAFKRRKRTGESPTPSLGGLRQRRETHAYRKIYNTPATRDDNLNERNTEAQSPSPPYPAQNARPSKRADRAARDPSQHQPLTEVEQVGLWEQFEQDDEEGGDSIDGQAGWDASHNAPSRPMEGDKMLDIDYKSDLPNALLNREADKVIRCLFAALHVNDRDFINGIPAATFSEIIRVLEPRNFLSPLASVHLTLSPAMTRQVGVAPLREVAYEYSSILRKVLEMRRGIRLTLSDFKALLRSARDLGNQKFALMLWHSLWAEGYTPDTKCYNLYMSAAVWNGVHSVGGRQKLRVTDFNMAARKKELPKNNFRQYRVGAGGVRETAMTFFNEMLANDVVANEESFRILITAAAREGDIATTKSILKKVWNVDTDAVLAGEDEATIAPKSFPTYSALYPTPQLLFAIAQAFGINNDIPSALRVVDFVARHYEIPITRTVWDQLFEWTFVLAVDRHGTDKNTGSEAGQLPSESAMSLWNTMVSEPYNIEPTMGMYNAIIKNLFQRGQTSLMVEKMREGRFLYYKHNKHARNRRRTLQSKLQGKEDPWEGSVENIRHKYEAADLERKKDLFLLKRWVRLLLASSANSRRGGLQEHSVLSELPHMLWHWRESAPTVVKYEAPTGFVEFKIRTSEEIGQFAMSVFRYKSKLREELKHAERYVGEKWVSGEVRPAKRLLARA